MDGHLSSSKLGGHYKASGSRLCAVGYMERGGMREVVASVEEGEGALYFSRLTLPALRLAFYS